VSEYIFFGSRVNNLKVLSFYFDGARATDGLLKSDVVQKQNRVWGKVKYQGQDEIFKRSA